MPKPFSKPIPQRFLRPTELSPNLLQAQTPTRPPQDNLFWSPGGGPQKDSLGMVSAPPQTTFQTTSKVSSFIGFLLGGPPGALQGPSEACVLVLGTLQGPKNHVFGVGALRGLKITLLGAFPMKFGSPKGFVWGSHALLAEKLSF